MELDAVVARATTEACFRYLADPRNRPRWQSSLRAVELHDTEVAAGMRWHDVTVVGLRPALEITRFEPFRLWEERGTWRGVVAVLALHFTALPDGTRISPSLSLTGRGPARAAAAVARLLAPAAIGADLRRAVAIIEAAGPHR